MPSKLVSWYAVQRAFVSALADPAGEVRARRGGRRARRSRRARSLARAVVEGRVPGIAFPAARLLRGAKLAPEARALLERAAAVEGDAGFDAREALGR